MATVYLAQDVKHNRPVAVKVLRPDLAASIAVTRFLKEIEIAAQLNHPHIVPLLDSGDVNGVLHFVMPFVEGHSVRGLLNGEDPITLATALAITQEAADALTYAHRKGLVHRDIKPENILLSEGHAVVADFGIANPPAVMSTTRIASPLRLHTTIAMTAPAANVSPSTNASPPRIRPRLVSLSRRSRPHSSGTCT